MIEIASRHTLPTLVARYLADLGFNWRAKALMPDPYVWTRPPLFTDLSLAGYPLQPHIAVRVNRDPDQLVDIYEQFVTEAVYTRRFYSEDVIAWLTKRLGLKRAVTNTIFTPTREGTIRRDLHLNLVQYAALVAWNVPSHVVDDPAAYIVTTEKQGYRFGVDGGHAVSNLRARRQLRTRTRRLASLSGSLLNDARGQPVVPPAATPYDMTRAFLETRRAQIGGEWEAINVALQALWWRTDGVYPVRLLDMTYRTRSTDALRIAIAEAGDFENFGDPLPVLYDIFVPQFLSQGHFRKLFGNPYVGYTNPPTLAMREKWRRALAELDPGPEQER